MLAGHYAASFAGKRAEPRVPLWVLFLAAQLVDILWAVFVLVGVERASLDFSLPSNALVAEYMPYTHSLLGTAVIATIAALVVWRWLGSWRGALVVGLVVTSHWFLDLPMHRPDLTLTGAGPKLGWQLWNYPLLAHGFELGVLMLSWLLLPDRRRGWAVILLLVLVVVQLYAILAPPPPTVTQMVLSLLVVYLAIVGLAAWLEPR
ncbi:MAG TPA: hypothetical protein VGR62_06730 [Candidatus Binatia bacterium]|jgi:hypothetical protein|nr:hypothetical protein [Candidatus Binatia bacterium]